MKLSKAELAAIVITVVFIVLAAVFTLSTRKDGALVTVSAQHPVSSEELLSASPSPPEATEQAIVNINTASSDELCSLPRIGEGLAQRIITYREKNGPFKSPDEIMNVSGIGAKTYEELEKYITTD